MFVIPFYFCCICLFKQLKEKMSTTQTIPSKVFTYKDYLKLDDDKRYEIINGELIMVPAPDLEHQETSGELDFLFRQYIKKNNLGKIFTAPTDVILDEKNTIQPDIIYVSKKNLHILRKKGIFGSPDCVVEILSPSSIEVDRYKKMPLYEKFKIKEYWIVDVANKAIEIFTLEDDKYKIFSFAAEKGIIKSNVIKGFKIEISKILESLMKYS